MNENPQWKGHDPHRDLPMLGVDPDAVHEWTFVDDGRRPDNRPPEMFTHKRYVGGLGEEGTVQHVGDRPDIGPILKGRPRAKGDGIILMAYHRELATRLNDPKVVVTDAIESTLRVKIAEDQERGLADPFLDRRELGTY